MKKFFTKNILFIILFLLLASILFTYSIGVYTISKLQYNAEAIIEGVYEYSYTGDVQEFVTPYTGIYKIEVYGAAGGDEVSNGYYGRNALGGRGGYSSGYIALDREQKLYVYVGGKGENVSNQTINQKGGYNGGAGGYSYSDTTTDDEWTEIENNTIYIAPGGGATHIATVKRGTLNTYSSNKSDIIMVAGGGGGAIYSYCSGKTYDQTGSTYENWIDPGYGNGGAGGGTIGAPTLTNVRNWRNGGELTFATGAAGGGGGWKSGYNASGATGYIREDITDGIMESNNRIGNGYAKITLVEVVSFTISYDANGAEGTTQPTITGQQDINGIAKGVLAQNSFTKEGYEFDSWNTKEDGTGDKYPAGSEILVGENTTLYAQWKPVTYNINCVLNGGEAENVTTYNIESENIVLNNPTRVGYVFKGWTGSNGETPQLTVRIEKGSYGDKQFVANWKANLDTPYMVRHWLQKLHAGTEQTEENYEQKALSRYSGESDSIVTPAVNNYIGYTSPTPQERTITADGSLIIDYFYPRNRYNFTLEECEGVNTTGSSENGIYEYEDEVTLRAQVQEGYTWIEWSNGEKDKTITIKINLSDIVITPIATKNEYTLTYKTNEIGSTTTVFGENPEKYTVTDESFTLINPTKLGYTFIGWTRTDDNATEEERTTPNLQVTIEKGSVGNKEFTANWVANNTTTYVVNHWLQNIDGQFEQYDENNYTKDFAEEKIGQTDTAVTPPVIEYEGFTSPEAQQAIILPDGSLVINYYYTRNKYTFTLEEAEGVSLIDSTDNGDYYFGEEIHLNANLQDGYTWQKWVETESGDEIESVNAVFTMISKNVTIRPVVTKNIYTINYNLNGGEVLEELKETYTVTDDSYTLPTPTKLGYVFTGWTRTDDNATEEEKTIPVLDITIANGATTNFSFEANWILDEHTIYNIEYYIQDINLENYVLYATETKEGITFAEVFAQEKAITGFKYDGENVNNIVSGNIKKDGSLVLKLYYNRNKYAINLETYEGQIEEGNVTEYIYEIETLLPTKVTKEGFIFKGWYIDQEYTTTPVTEVAVGSVGEKTYYAKWEKVAEPLVITSQQYQIDMEAKEILKIPSNTKVKDLLQQIQINRTAKIVDENNNELDENSLVGTKCKIQIQIDETNVEDYELFVTGDISGNGEVDIVDLTTLNRYRIGMEMYQTKYVRVLDLDGDNSVNIVDLTIMVNIILRKTIM